jgi:hypothetical protein
MEGRRPNLEGEETLEVFELARNKAKALGVDLRLPTSQGAIRVGDLINFCTRTGKFTPIIRVDGKALLCWGREDLTIGSIPDLTLEQILESSWRIEAVNRLKELEALPFCESCSLCGPSDITLNPPSAMLVPWPQTTSANTSHT